MIEPPISASGLTRTGFVLEGHSCCGLELLVEQVWSSVAPGLFSALCRLLDAPPNPSSRHHPLAAHHATADFDCGDASLNHSASTTGSNAGL